MLLAELLRFTQSPRMALTPRPHSENITPPGSSTQVAVLIVPFCVLLAWAMGQPLDLNFNEFEALVLFISVLLAVVVLQDGSSNYLKGLMLVITYLFISAGEGPRAGARQSSGSGPSACQAARGPAMARHRRLVICSACALHRPPASTAHSSDHAASSDCEHVVNRAAPRRLLAAQGPRAEGCCGRWGGALRRPHRKAQAQAFRT